MAREAQALMSNGISNAQAKPSAVQSNENQKEELGDSSGKRRTEYGVSIGIALPRRLR